MQGQSESILHSHLVTKENTIAFIAQMVIHKTAHIFLLVDITEGRGS